MEWFLVFLLFWTLSFATTYLVVRHIDKTDYTRKDMDLPEESNHLYLQNEAYNRYEDRQYDRF